MNREEWLNLSARSILRNVIGPHTATPATPYRISVGFSLGNRKAIGTCWRKEASKDGTNEIFMSPVESDSLNMLATLTHELIHYTDNCASGHKGHFAKTARAAGLIGKLTATQAGPKLTQQLQHIIDAHGPIPHAALTPANSGKKKQTTRMIKVVCKACNFNFRASAKQIEKLHDKSTCPACMVGVLGY